MDGKRQFSPECPRQSRCSPHCIHLANAHQNPPPPPPLSLPTRRRTSASNFFHHVIHPLPNRDQAKILELKKSRLDFDSTPNEMEFLRCAVLPAIFGSRPTKNDIFVHMSKHHGRQSPGLVCWLAQEGGCGAWEEFIESRNDCHSKLRCSVPMVLSTGSKFITRGFVQLSVSTLARTTQD